MVNLKRSCSTITTAEFNGLSSEIYGNEISHSELKIFAKNIPYSQNISWAKIFED